MNGTKIETDFLEQLFADDCKCESEHEYTECSVNVIWSIEVCYRPGSRNVCATTIRSLQTRCKGCFNRASECWTIRPI